MSRRSFVLVTIIVTATVAVCGVLYYLSLPQQGVLFRGAYAVYSGTLFLGFMSQNVLIRVEVLDFNTTHVYLQVETTVNSTAYLTFTGKPETKVNKTVDRRWLPRNIFTNLTYRGEEEEYVEFLGRTRRCKVYINASDATEVILYVDKETAWPVKAVITIKQIGAQMTLKLVDTNIFRK